MVKQKCDNIAYTHKNNVIITIYCCILFLAVYLLEFLCIDILNILTAQRIQKAKWSVVVDVDHNTSIMTKN